MRYIKEYSKYEPSYYEVSYEDYMDMFHRKKRVYFESAEVNMLLDYLKSKDSKIIINQKAYIRFGFGTFSGDINHYKINLFRFEDEWFCLSIRGLEEVTHYYKYYKCDQISGVIDCLESIIK
jgi:hypothetical protein